jgi:hypothetical protein
MNLTYGWDEDKQDYTKFQWKNILENNYSEGGEGDESIRLREASKK